jgi:hypothetical protein
LSGGCWAIHLRHSGMVRRTRPGISRFSDVQLHIVVRCFASPRNDSGLLRRGACHRARIRATRWLLAMTRTCQNAV